MTLFLLCSFLSLWILHLWHIRLIPIWHLKRLRLFYSGQFFEVLPMNWHNVYWRYFDIFPSERLMKVLALFLFGYYLMSISYFTKYAPSFKFLIFSGITGVSITYLSYEVEWSMASYSHSLHDIALASTGTDPFSNVLYFCLNNLRQDKFFNRRFHHSFVYMGRMSFTNYLMHTVFGFMIFIHFLVVCLAVWGF